jgi:predicted nucleic acid-binding protein
LLAEVEDVLSRESVRIQFPALTPDVAQAFVTDVRKRGILLDPVPFVFTWPLHPDDDHLFNLAIHAKAKYLVTWETRILELPRNTSPVAALLRQLAPDLQIVTPKELIEILKSTPPK